MRIVVDVPKVICASCKREAEPKIFNIDANDEDPHGPRVFVRGPSDWMVARAETEIEKNGVKWRRMVEISICPGCVADVIREPMIKARYE